MKIFLIGLPGSGKTTLGKQVAEKLNTQFYDLDNEIETAENLTISKIFSIKGEDYFRKAESGMLKKFCDSPKNFVLSTGGGVPCFNENMQSMNQSGTTIFLDVPAQEIANRLMKTNLSERPLFAKMNPEVLKDKIEFLRSQRIGFYQQAQLILKGITIDAKEIINAIKGYTQTL